MTGSSHDVFVADERAPESPERPPARVDLARLRRLANHVLAEEEVPAEMAVAVLCVDADAIAELHAHHLGGEGPTDVLAFPLDAPGEALPGAPAILGDVVLCPEVAAEQASSHDGGLDAELDLLVVHGLLHLLGHDHAVPAERRAMFTLTERLLESFGTSGPPGWTSRGEERAP